MTITGGNFGSSGTVEFFRGNAEADVAAPIVSWANEQIICTVPVIIVIPSVKSAGSGPVKVRTGSGTSDGYAFHVTFGYGQMKWPGQNPTIQYYINENTYDCTGEGAAVQRAASTWSAAGARFKFEPGGSSTLTAPDLYNRRNDVMWGRIDDLAVTYSARSTLTGNLLDCDLVFNDDEDWSASDTPPAGRYDVEAVALHEFGHWLKLADLYGSEYDDEKVMYGIYTHGKLKRALHADDIAGIQWIYPPLAYVNIGLRVYDGTSVISIACEPAGTLTSPLRIARNGTIYGIVLVDPSDSSASKMRIGTSSGVKALRKY